jgi:uncharacterized membrane protein YwzB
MRYTGVLTGSDSIIILICGFVFFAIFFWLIPQLRRRDERGKAPIFSGMGFASFGPWYFRMGGIFYRITAYENFLVIAFWGHQIIKYSDVEKITIKNGLSIEVHGVPVQIFLVNDKKLKALHSLLIQFCRT